MGGPIPNIKVLTSKFKPGDLVKNTSRDTYCVYDGSVFHTIFENNSDSSGLWLTWDERFWEVAYREDLPDAQTPDALHTTHPYLLEGGEVTLTQPCCCSIVTLMQTGCKCGGK